MWLAFGLTLCSAWGLQIPLVLIICHKCVTQVSGKEDCRGEGGISPGLEVTQWLECGPRGSVHIRHMGTTGSAAIVGGLVCALPSRWNFPCGQWKGSETPPCRKLFCLFGCRCLYVFFRKKVKIIAQSFPGL